MYLVTDRFIQLSPQRLVSVETANVLRHVPCGVSVLARLREGRVELPEDRTGRRFSSSKVSAWMTDKSMLHESR